MSALEVQFAALTDVGRVRDQNEDNFLVDKKLGLFIVCDGMGGHAAGEVASALAVRIVHDEIKKQSDLISDHAAAAVGAAKVNKRGMGTTLVCLLVIGSQAFIVYVGDSRIYMLRGGLLEQLTEDHTVYNELIRRKKMPREQVEQLAQKNAITRAVGVYEHVEPDTLVLDLTAGDRFLLCSDGLCGYFEEDLEGLGKRLGNPDADAACKSLVETANERGGKDNITSVIVTVGDVTARDEMRAKQLQLKREILARMPLFRPLNDREILRVLQVTDVHDYQNGEIIISEGDKGEELFIMLSGQATVIRNGAELATFNAGDHFGEMALVRSQPRSATVRSSGKSELMVIRRAEFFEILRKEHQLAVKLLWQFLGVLADRLADTSRELGAAKEELALEDISGEIFADDDDDNRKTLIIPPPPPSLRGG